MSKKQAGKAQKMSLSAFLADESTGSWAAETNDMPIAHQELPTSSGDHQQQDDSFRSGRYGSGGGGSRFGGRDDAPQRPGLETRPHRQSDREFASSRSFRREDTGPKEIPTRPPFIAYFGNLENGVVEADVEELLAGLQVANIRLIKDADGAFKGFGYIEFKTADALVSALKFNGQTHHGRQLRVDVAENKKTDRPSRGGYGDREEDAKFEGEWRRDKPAAPTAVRAQFRSGRSEDRPHRRDDRPRESSVDEAKFESGWRRDKPATPQDVREPRRFEDRPHRRDDGPREPRQPRERSVEDPKLQNVWRRDTPATPQAVREPPARREGSDRPSFKPRDDAVPREPRQRPAVAEDPKLAGAWRRDTPAAPQAVREPPVVRKDGGDRPPRKEGAAAAPRADRPPRPEKEESNLDFGAWRRGDVKKEPTAFETTKGVGKAKPTTVVKKLAASEDKKQLLETQGK